MTTLAQWKKQKQHDVTLASGVKVTIELPNIVDLVRSGTLPSHLVPIALGQEKPAGDGTMSQEDVQKHAEFVDYIVAQTVVEPNIEPKDVRELPAEDQELLLGIATRTTNRDGTGRHIAGLEVQDDFSSFRGLGPSGTPALGL